MLMLAARLLCITTYVYRLVARQTIRNQLVVVRSRPSALQHIMKSRDGLHGVAAASARQVCMPEKRETTVKMPRYRHRRSFEVPVALRSTACKRTASRPQVTGQP